MGGQEERVEGAVERGMLDSVSEERSGQKTATGYSGLFSWENTEGRGRGVTEHNGVPHSSERRTKADRRICFVALANISCLLYTSELNRKGADGRMSKETKSW